MMALLFPGQGSQQKDMGQGLFLKFPTVVRTADEILGYLVEELCLEDPLERLNQTQFTQLAMYVVNVLSYLAWSDVSSEQPSYLMGHSLGEYNTLFAAKIFDFETGLKHVMKRGELMSQSQAGAMVAVVGLNEQQIYEILKDRELQAVTIANKNSRTQFVLSGSELEVIKLKKLCEDEGALLAIRLNVSGAFHSQHMHLAKQEFEVFINNFEFDAPQIPVLANCTAALYQRSDQEINKTLYDQIAHSVLWTDSIDYLLRQNVMEFMEFGAGSVLTGLICRIKNVQ